MTKVSRPPTPPKTPSPEAAQRRQSSSQQAGRQFRRGFKLGLRYSFRLALLALVLCLGATPVLLRWQWMQIQKDLPDSEEVFTFARDGTMTIKADDGSILQKLGPLTRDPLSSRQLPDRVKQAFIASEDRHFYDHSGVDVGAILRAILKNVREGEVVEGGSTITQQLARIVFLDQEKSLDRKFREAMLSQKMERELTKAEILERYLNLVYLGAGAYGVGDAAWIYFSKSVDELTIGEAATIAGMAPAPSLYSPLVNEEAARKQRNRVLRRMGEEGFISKAVAEAAMQEPLKLHPSSPKHLDSITPYFTTYVQKELLKYVPPEVVERGGLTIETTLNTNWQRQAEKVITETVELDGPGQGFTQASLVSIDPRKGEIKAMVGGASFGKSQFNRATQAQRQPGSTFKPFVYATAIAAGSSPTDGYADAPYRVGGYEPQNYGRSFRGWVTMKDALTYSINVVAVKVLVEVGFDPIIKVAHAMGIKSELHPTYSLALGASEVNLLELTSAYGTFANRGKHIEPHAIRRIINSKGEVLFDAQTLKPKQAIDADTAAIMTWVLQGVVQSGTGQAADIGRPVAGKTGTSEEARDLWFIGYIPQVVTGIWLGNDDNTPTWGASSTAAYSWHLFMNPITEKIPVENFPEVPPLWGRKATIKRQPVGANQSVPQNSYNNSSNNSDRAPAYQNYEPQETEPRASETTPSNAEPNQSGDSPQTSGSSRAPESYSEPPASSSSAPVVVDPQPAPAPAEPVIVDPVPVAPNYEVPAEAPASVTFGEELPPPVAPPVESEVPPQ